MDVHDQLIGMCGLSSIIHAYGLMKSVMGAFTLIKQQDCINKSGHKQSVISTEVHWRHLPGTGITSYLMETSFALSYLGFWNMHTPL